MIRREFLRQALGAGAVAPFALSHAAAPTPAAGLRPINIVSTAGTTNLVILALIQQMGYFTRLGVTPRHVTVADGSKVVAALISGAADICPTSGFTQVLAAIEKGAALRIIGGGAIKNFNALFTGNPAVRTLKDLEGRSVGIGSLGSQLHQTMIALFRKYGIDGSKITYANVGSSVDVFRAVKARVIDAGCAEVWLHAGSGLRIVENGKTFESLPEFVNQAAFCSSRAIATKREALVRTLAAYAMVYRFVMSGDSEAAFIAASARALGKNDVAGARAQWRFYRDIQPFAADLILAEDRVRYMQGLNVSTGTQRRILSYDAVADMSLARDALKLI